MFDKKPKALCITGIGEANDEDYVTVVIIPDTPEIVDSISVTSFHFYIEYNNNTISWQGYGAVQIAKISIIINKFRPRRLSSEQIIISPS